MEDNLENYPDRQDPDFSEKSFRYLGLDNIVRRIAIAVIQSKWFERASMLVIAANCFALGSADPCDSACETATCSVLQIVELAIFLFFVVEMLVKMVAMGVWGPKSYLGEPWNRLDCLIVFAGMLEYVFVNSEVNFSAIRAFRVLRPLRAINRITSLRLLVNLLLDILPMLGHVMILCFFIFFVFGTVAVQLWAGALRHRCFFPTEGLSDQPPPFMPPFYFKAHNEYVCSPSNFGMFHCSTIPEIEAHGSLCAELFDEDPEKMEVCKIFVKNYTDCRPEGPNPAKGTINFDNIAYASIAIFQVISLEGWSEVMYLVQDSYSPWVWTYFVSLVLLGSYLAVNLCLVVIAAQFSVTKMRERAKMRIERMQASKLQSMSVVSLDLSNVTGTSTGGRGDLYMQILNLLIYCGQTIIRWITDNIPCPIMRKQEQLQQQLQPQLQLTTGANSPYSRSPVCQNCRLAPASSYRPLDKPFNNSRQASFNTDIDAGMPPLLKCQLCGESLEPDKGNDVQVRRTQPWTRFEKFQRFRHTSRAWLKRTLESKVATIFVMLCIIINAVIMACEHHNQSDELTYMTELTNVIFTVIFLLELVIKLYSFGLHKFVQEAFNVLDAAIISINVIELFTDGHGSGFAVLRLFRLVRIVKIVRFMPALQRQLLIMIHTVDHVATFFLLLTFFLFISALLGMSLFGCKFCVTTNFGRSEVMFADDEGAISIERCKFSVRTFFPAEDEQSLNSSVSIENSTFQQQVYTSCAVANFDNLGQALFTVLQVFTQDDWASVMKDGMHNTSDWAGLYFVALVTLGNYIIFNLLVAILVEGFSAKSEEAVMKANRSALTTKTNSISGSDPNSRFECVRRIKKCFLYTKNKFSECWHAEVSDHSLFLFPPDAFFRIAMQKGLTSKYYEPFFFIVIFVNCVLIAIEHPGMKPDSTEKVMLKTVSLCVNFVFVIDTIIKIIASGLFFGRDAYLRNRWNILDLFLLCTAISDTVLFDMLHSERQVREEVLQTFHVIRALRALRPIRLVAKAKGLKIVIETLAMSVKPLGNIVLICFFFFIIFAILGVQLFRGCFSRCIASRDIPSALFGTNETNITKEAYTRWVYEMIPKVTNKSTCLDYGLIWQTESYNFDSLPDALMSLFVFSTLDGWADITRNGVACVGVDTQPIPNYNGWNFVYFAGFLLIVCFFAMNMFVGVVVNNFQKVQKRMEAELLAIQKENQVQRKKMLSRLQRRVTVVAETVTCHHASCFPCFSAPEEELRNKRRLFKQKAFERGTSFVFDYDIPFWIGYPVWRRNIYKFVTHRYFEYFMTVATTFNVVSMACEFYMMPPVFDLSIKIMSYVFLGLLLLETTGKLIALGPRRYMSDRWNKLDITILSSSIAGSILEELNSSNMSVDSSVIGIARIFRIARVIKLWRAATGVRKLLKTISLALPQVANLSLLFLLLFFIYASVGVELYGRFDCTYDMCDGLSRHANFNHFGNALLTLFRIFTGDDWNGILKDILRLSNDPIICQKAGNHALADSHEGGINCDIIHMISPAYFVSFVVLAQFVLINVVVAVLMRQIEDGHKEQIHTSVYTSKAPKIKRDTPKETCFVDQVDFAVIAKERPPLGDAYYVRKLQKIADGIEDDSDDEDYQFEDVAVPVAEPPPEEIIIIDETLPDYSYNAPMASFDTQELSGNIPKYDAIAEIRQAMDSQIIRRVCEKRLSIDASSQEEPTYLRRMTQFAKNAVSRISVDVVVEDQF